MPRTDRTLPPQFRVPESPNQDCESSDSPDTALVCRAIRSLAGPNFRSPSRPLQCVHLKLKHQPLLLPLPAVYLSQRFICKTKDVERGSFGNADSSSFRRLSALNCAES